MVKKDGAAPPQATEFREGTAEGSEMKEKKAKDTRRKRRELRRMKSSSAKDANFNSPARHRPDIGSESCNQEASMEISLSFPASSSSSENDDVKGEDEMSSCSGSHGVVSIVGRRRQMEDAVAIELGFSNEYDFYGVYDGHGGCHVANECKDTLHRVVAEEMVVGGGEGKMNWEKVMVGSFGKMDEVVKKVGEEMKTIGSTAVIAMVGKKEIVVANCGDSRAVMCRGGVAVALSNDHKPDRPDELERVEAAGGKVINWNGNRVLGVLATSRSVGDEYLRPFIISEPEVQICERTDQDEFLILASDGLWDVVSNEMACRIVRKCLYGRVEQKELKGTNRATAAASLLAELAMARGSRDNISAIVVQLRKSRLTVSNCS